VYVDEINVAHVKHRNMKRCSTRTSMRCDAMLVVECYTGTVVLMQYITNIMKR